MSQSELIAIKDAIDGIYKNEIYDNEYTFEESKYIIKEPMIHLDVDKILEDLKNSCCDIRNIGEKDLIYEFDNTVIRDHSKCKKCFEIYTGGSGEFGPHVNRCVNYGFRNGGMDLKTIAKLNFPIEINLCQDEYIIKTYLLNNNYYDSKINGSYYSIPKSYNKSSKIISIIYITNYGRIIKSNDLFIVPSIFQYTNKHNHYDNNTYKFEYIMINGIIIYNNNKTKINSTGEYDDYCNPREFLWLIIGGDSNKIKLIEQPKLLYRIPRLFIDVIDAFHTQNTDLMQKCCKQYLEISRESKVKESIMKDIKIKEIKDEKDNIIKEKDNIIDDKNKEIDDLKIKLEMLQQKYDKIKAMFD